LVVLEIDSVRIALCVDRVRDPEEFETDDVITSSTLGSGKHGPVDELIAGLVKTAFGPIPVIAPRALTNRALLQRLGPAIEQVMREHSSHKDVGHGIGASEEP
jgi:hypothetical protein